MHNACWSPKTAGVGTVNTGHSVAVRCRCVEDKLEAHNVVSFRPAAWCTLFARRAHPRPGVTSPTLSTRSRRVFVRITTRTAKTTGCLGGRSEFAFRSFAITDPSTPRPSYGTGRTTTDDDGPTVPDPGSLYVDHKKETTIWSHKKRCIQRSRPMRPIR